MSVVFIPRLKFHRFLPYLYNHFPRRAMAGAVVISGPSGSGKSTMLTRLFDEFPGCFAFSVSHTTRKPRPGETDGTDYHFVTVKEFEAMVEKGDFLEHAKFSGNCYGTSKKSVEDIQETGRTCILDVEINGVKSIKASDLNARYVFLQPPDMDTLKQRLIGRKTETDDSLQRRLESAKEAMDYAAEEDSYDYKVVNDDLETAYSKFKDIFTNDIKVMKKGQSKSGD